MLLIYNASIIKFIFILWSICFLLFCITIFVFVFYSLNYIFLLILNEVLLFLLMIILISCGYLYDDLNSQIFVLFLLVVSSCEIVIGLSLILYYEKNYKTY